MGAREAGRREVRKACLAIVDMAAVVGVLVGGRGEKGSFCRSRWCDVGELSTFLKPFRRRRLPRSNGRRSLASFLRMR